MHGSKSSHRRIALTLLLLSSAACACGQDLDTAPLSFLHWRLIGSFRGGRVTSVVGVPDDPNVYYFGTPGGGIWKTTDAGHVWRPIFDAQHVASIGALAIAPSDSKIIYAGTGEQTPGKGVYKSSDGGDTWTAAGLEDTRFIQAVIVDPHDPNTLIAGANSIGVYIFSKPYPLATFTTPRGVFKSTDGGKSWTQTLKNDQSAGVFDLEVDPDDPHILYASVYVPSSPQAKSADQEGSAQSDSLLYRSTDQGSTWTLLPCAGLPATGRDRLGISVAPETGGKRLYAIVQQGFFRSDDAGATWTKSTTDPRVIGNAYFSRIFVDTKNPDILYVAQTSLYRSLDGGHTFSAYVGAPSGDDFHVLWIDPKNPRRLFLGVDQGAILSVDGGASWSSWYNQPTGQFYHVTTDNAFPYRTYAAQQDSGTQSVPSRSDNGQITPQDVTSVGGFEYCHIAPDPLNPDFVYSGGWYGTVVRFDRKSGQLATLFEKGESYRVSQMPPLFFSPHDPHTLYLGTQSVLKTADQGRTWQPISPDLTEWKKSDEAKADESDKHPPALEALTESPVAAGEMWATTGNRLVQLTRDGGAHWQKVTPPGLEAPYELLYVEASHHDAGTAYLTVGTSRQSLPPQVLRTRDFGATWQSIIQGLPAKEGIRVVREDPVRRGLLFAGTETTVYASFDDGDHWHPLTLNLPASPVTDITVHGDDLVIATYGRGLWILDNISPIRQLTPELSRPALHLFQPATALRVRWDTYQDTPLPLETPAGQNPPDGIAIDYTLSAPADRNTTITIRDAGGKVVRTYSTVSTEPNLPLPNVPEYWFATPTTVDATPGSHRLIWDLRYPAPRTLPASYYGPILQYTEYTLADHAIPYQTPRQQPQGPLVVPGLYTVELNSGGRKLQQQITVKLDPRVHATAADLDAQSALAHRILGGIDLSYQEFHSAAALSDALEQKSKTQPEPAAQLKKQVQQVQEGNGTMPGLGAINRDLTRLLNSVESGDQHPTELQVQAVNQVCAALTKVNDQWKSLNDSLKIANPLQLPVAAVSAEGCGH